MSKVISAVVCTHNRLPFLKRCLTALREQTLGSDKYDIIVVDNCSSDGTREYVRCLEEVCPQIIYVHEGKLGLSAARNAGLRAATGQYVAYTDDDAEPYPDWLEKLVNIFETVHPQPAVVGGEVEPVWGAPQPAWLDTHCERMLSGRLGWSDTPMFVAHPQNYLCEVNCAYRRDILERYGPWPEELGRIGSILLSSENAINFGIYEREKTLLFDPDLKVRHHIHADRLTLRWMAQRHFWQGVSRAIVEKQFGIARLPGTGDAAESFFNGARKTLDLFSPEASVQQIHEGFGEQFLLGWYLQHSGRLGMRISTNVQHPKEMDWGPVGHG